ncbi:unnamed protein product, partial [Ectocarpus sp. 13 AM-2016]
LVIKIKRTEGKYSEELGSEPRLRETGAHIVTSGQQIKLPQLAQIKYCLLRIPLRMTMVRHFSVWNRSNRPGVTLVAVCGVYGCVQQQQTNVFCPRKYKKETFRSKAPRTRVLNQHHMNQYFGEIPIRSILLQGSPSGGTVGDLASRGAMQEDTAATIRVTSSYYQPSVVPR